MKSRAEKAVENHKCGYNCAQSVACAYADLVGETEEQLYRVTEGFGSGMGGLAGTCGAVTAAVLLASLYAGEGIGGKSRPRTARLARTIVGEFQKKNGSVICRELKGIGGGPVLRECSGCVADAAELLETYVFEEEEQ